MYEFIDPHALKAIASLQRPGKPDLLTKVVELFKSESPKAIAAMHDGVAAGDLTSVRNAAHTLKSSSAYVGAKILSERCRDLETAAREDNYPACTALSEAIGELFDDCCAELDRYGRQAA